MSESEYNAKISALQQEVEALEKTAKSKECFPFIWVVAAITPLIIWLLFYFIQPSFVQREDNGVFVRDHSKIFMWTVVMTAIFWCIEFLYTKFVGAKKTVCVS